MGIVAAVLAFISLGGFADARVKLKRACATDIAKFCPDIKKGEGRKSCLLKHPDELTPACSELLKERRLQKAGNAKG